MTARQRGVTLIELLVVMAILAFVATLAVVNAPPARSSAKEEAERFAARVQAAWEDAVIRGSVASVALDARGYRVERLVGQEWVPDETRRRFGARALPPAVALVVELRDPAGANEKDTEEAEPAAPRIVLDPIGATTPFAVAFTDRQGRWLVSNRDDQTIVVARDDGR